MKKRRKFSKLLKKIVGRLYVSNEDYKNSRKEIRTSNMNMLVASSAICMANFLILFGISFIPFAQKMRLVYGTEAFLSLLIFIISTTFLKKHTKYVSIMIYFLIISLYAVGIVTDVFFHRLSHSAIFSAFQIICPLLIVDRTFRMFIFNGFWTIVYLVLVSVFKPPMIAIADRFNGICFFTIGCIMNMYFSHLRTREFVLQHTIKKERDTDELTGILNKSSAIREIRKNLSCKSSNGIFIICDVDDFKKINDTYGHDIGDKVLVNIANVLKTTFRKTDIIGRFGGDEFIIFMTGLVDLEIAETRALKAEEDLKLIKIPGTNLKVGGSFGIALAKPSGENFDNLFKKADIALYDAKNAGKGRISVNHES